MNSRTAAFNRSPSNRRLEVSKSDGNLNKQKALSMIPMVQSVPRRKNYSWKSALLPEVDYRYRLLRTQATADDRTETRKRLYSRLSLLSNSPRKYNKANHSLTRHNQMDENASLKGLLGSWTTVADSLSQETKNRVSQLSTNITPMTRAEDLENTDTRTLRIEYLKEELTYLRSRFLRHYQNHHGTIPTIPEENLIQEEKSLNPQNSSPLLAQVAPLS